MLEPNASEADTRMSQFDPQDSTVAVSSTINAFPLIYQIFREIMAILLLKNRFSAALSSSAVNVFPKK